MLNFHITFLPNHFLCYVHVFQARGFVKEYVNFSKEIVVSELELNTSTDAISYKS